MSKLREFISSLPPASDKSADPGGDQPAFSPDDIFAQTLRASGYKAGSDPCEDACWEAYQRCLKQSRDGGMSCMAQLQTCRDNCARNRPPDSTDLTAVDSVYVSADGGKSPVASPNLGVEYDWCVKIVNKLVNKPDAPSGPFFVRFDLKGAQTMQLKFDHQGLMVGAEVLAVVHFGKFPNAGKYTLGACIYASSAPNKQVSCAASIDFVVK